MCVPSHFVIPRFNAHFYSHHNPYAIGEKLVNFLVEPKKGTKWPKELPKFNSRPDAIAICKDLCGRQFIHRSEKVAKGELEVRSFLLVSFLCRAVWEEDSAAFFRVADGTHTVSLLVLFSANKNVKGFLLIGFH